MIAVYAYYYLLLYHAGDDMLLLFRTFLKKY